MGSRKCGGGAAEASAVACVAPGPGASKAAAAHIFDMCFLVVTAVVHQIVRFARSALAPLPLEEQAHY